MSKLWLIKNWGSEILNMPLGLFVISLSFGSFFFLDKVKIKWTYTEYDSVSILKTFNILKSSSHRYLVHVHIPSKSCKSNYELMILYSGPVRLPVIAMCEDGWRPKLSTARNASDLHFFSFSSAFIYYLFIIIHLLLCLCFFFVRDYFIYLLLCIYLLIIFFF